jgi:hypothetical protein
MRRRPRLKPLLSYNGLSTVLAGRLDLEREQRLANADRAVAPITICSSRLRFDEVPADNLAPRPS